MSWIWKKKKKPGKSALMLQKPSVAGFLHYNDKSTRSFQQQQQEYQGCCANWMDHEVIHSRRPKLSMSLNVQEPDKWLLKFSQSREMCWNLRRWKSGRIRRWRPGRKENLISCTIVSYKTKYLNHIYKQFILTKTLGVKLKAKTFLFVKSPSRNGPKTNKVIAW